MKVATVGRIDVTPNPTFDRACHLLILAPRKPLEVDDFGIACGMP